MPRCTGAPGSSISCQFFEPLLYLLSIGVGVGSYVTQMEGMSYVQFLAPGLVAVAAMNGASFEVTYNTFVRLNYEKTYDSMLTTPIQPEDLLFGEVLWAVTRACIYGGCFFVVIAALGLAPLPSAFAALLVIPAQGSCSRPSGSPLAPGRDDRPVQLLLHPVLDAALLVQRHLLSLEGAVAGWLAVARRGPASPAPGSPRSCRLPRRTLPDSRVGRALYRGCSPLSCSRWQRARRASGSPLDARAHKPRPRATRSRQVCRPPCPSGRGPRRSTPAIGRRPRTQALRRAHGGEESVAAGRGVEGRARHAGTLPSTFEKPRQGGASQGSGSQRAKVSVAGTLGARAR